MAVGVSQATHGENWLKRGSSSVLRRISKKPEKTMAISRQNWRDSYVIRKIRQVLDLSTRKRLVISTTLFLKYASLIQGIGVTEEPAVELQAIVEAQ